MCPTAITSHDRTTPDRSVLMFRKGNSPTLPPPFSFQSCSRLLKTFFWPWMSLTEEQLYQLYDTCLKTPSKYKTKTGTSLSKYEAKTGSPKTLPYTTLPRALGVHLRNSWTPWDPYSAPTQRDRGAKNGSQGPQLFHCAPKTLKSNLEILTPQAGLFLKFCKLFVRSSRWSNKNNFFNLFLFFSPKWCIIGPKTSFCDQNPEI